MTSFFVVLPGRALREPGIQWHWRAARLDPGSALRAVRDDIKKERCATSLGDVLLFAVIPGRAQRELFFAVIPGARCASCFCRHPGRALCALLFVVIPGPPQAEPGTQ